MPNYLCNNLYLCSSPYSSLPSPLLRHHLLSEAWHDLSSATERTEKIMEKKIKQVAQSLAYTTSLVVNGNGYSSNSKSNCWIFIVVIYYTSLGLKPLMGTELNRLESHQK